MKPSMKEGYSSCFVYRLDGICGLFERRLKKDNPHTRKLTYDIKDLFDYVDRLRDISCLM